MTAVAFLECRRCGRRYDPGDVEYTCPEHDGIDGVLDVRYDETILRQTFDGVTEGRLSDLWDFEALLPVDGGARVSLGAGGTPLLDAPTASDRLGVRVRVKDETGNPTGSNKDRGSAVVVTRAVQEGYDVVSCASTGNAAASLAGYAARAGLDCRIFVPRDLPEAKAVQPRLSGADVLAVDGSYEDAYDLCRAVSTERGWYNRSAALNPYAVEGNRTLGFELATQAPDADWVVMAMGNGCSLAGAWKGVATLDRMGLVDGTPRFLGVQAAGATAIYDEFVGESDAARSPGPHDSSGEATPGTVADSIDVGTPHNASRACDALTESGGEAVVVDDEAILAAQRLLGESEGLFVEPASAAAVAGVAAAREDGIIDGDDEVVLVASGTGLKDPVAAGRAAPDVRDVGADPDDVPESF